MAKAHRLKGVGKKLVSEIEGYAYGAFNTLQLYTNNPQSSAFYLALGYKLDGKGKSSHSKKLKT